jgi:AraC-like DNA-binding protein
MTHITTYQCNDLHRQRLYIPDLRAYLQREDSYLHIVKGTLLCICRRGAAQVKINYTTYNVQEGDLIAILPSHLFCFEDYSQDCLLEALLYSDEYWSSLSQAVDYQLILQVEHQPQATLPEHTRAEVFTLLRYIERHDAVAVELDAHSAVERTIAGALAYSLLMLLVSNIRQSPAEDPHLVSRKEVLTHDFFTLLFQHYETERAVTFYASKLCVTPKHLSSTVKEVTRCPLLEWINNLTILNIKRRLLTGQDTIQELADELNFQTPSTFVRYFRQHTGITPSRYRTLNRSAQ